MCSQFNFDKVNFSMKLSFENVIGFYVGILRIFSSVFHTNPAGNVMHILQLLNTQILYKNLHSFAVHSSGQNPEFIPNVSFFVPLYFYLSTTKGLWSVEGQFCKANVNLLNQPLYWKKVDFHFNGQNKGHSIGHLSSIGRAIFLYYA